MIYERLTYLIDFDINQFLILEKNLQNTINCCISNWWDRDNFAIN